MDSTTLLYCRQPIWNINILLVHKNLINLHEIFRHIEFQSLHINSTGRPKLNVWIIHFSGYSKFTSDFQWSFLFLRPAETHWKWQTFSKNFPFEFHLHSHWATSWSREFVWPSASADCHKNECFAFSPNEMILPSLRGTNRMTDELLLNCNKVLHRSKNNGKHIFQNRISVGHRYDEI